MSDNGKNVGQLLLDEFIRLRELLQQQVDRQSYRTTLPQVGSRIQVSETPVVINNAPNDPPLCTADPRRWLLAFSSVGVGGFIASMQKPDGTTGIASLNSSPIVIDFPKFGPLCQQQWWAEGISGALTVTVYQVILLPAR